MEYIKLFWEDTPEGEPPVILYEVDTDHERMAIRSIDVFADGSTRNIDNLYDGAIEITPIPTVEEFNAHVWGKEFHARLIEKAEFESSWEKCSYGGGLKSSEVIKVKGRTKMAEWNKVNFGTGKVTFLDDTRKEDMLQVEYPNCFLLDMGWYQNRYIIDIIQDFDWEHPVKQFETADRKQLPDLLTEAVRSVEQASQKARLEES